MAEEKPKKASESYDPAETKKPAGDPGAPAQPPVSAQPPAGGPPPQQTVYQGSGTIRGTVFNDVEQQGISGVAVRLLLCTTNQPVAGMQNPAITDADGNYQFLSLPTSSYLVVFPFDPARPSSLSATTADPNLQKEVNLKAGQEREVDFHYGFISGRLVLQGGAGIGFTSGVKLADQYGSSTARDTDANGGFEFEVPVGEGYALTVPASVGSGVSGIASFPLKDGRFNNGVANLASPSTLSDIVYSSGPLIGGITGQIQQIEQSTETIAAIIPTAMQGSPAYQGAIPPAGSGLVAYDQVVDASFTRVLGARPNGDATKIMNLLNSSFASSEVNGQTYYTWQPRGVTTVSSSMGQLVGGQVTLYQQAQDIQTQVTRLLDAVEPVILDADDDDIAAFKRDIAASLAAIVAETGRPGGAVTPRVLVLQQTLQADLATLGTKLGLTGQVEAALFIDMDVTEKEQNQQDFNLLTNLLMLGGTLDQLLKTNTANFSGTQLARLNWLAEVIPNTVQQIYAAMDSVGFGPADRRVTSISANDSTTIEQLLLWIESAASVDWPNRLVAGSARTSEVQAVGREAAAQKAGVAKLLNSLPSIILLGADRPLPVLKELQRELDQVSALAQSIAPVLSNTSFRNAAGIAGLRG